MFPIPIKAEHGGVYLLSQPMPEVYLRGSPSRPAWTQILDLILKITEKQKGLVVQVKWWSACLVSRRP
jgi:hypothetical protein